MSKSKSLKMLFSDVLREKLNNGVGTSRFIDKKEKNDVDKIYAFETFRKYKDHVYYFCDWLRERFPSVKTIEDARVYCNQYLTERAEKGLSPSTLKTDVSALAKVYGLRSSDFVSTPSRLRSELTRSRCAVKYDRHFSEENNYNLVQFCKSTGLRRNELEHCRGNFLVEKDGSYFLDFTGSRSNYCKGGRPRLVPIINNVELVVSLCRSAGEGLVFPKVHHACDVHSYRAEYCRDIYKKALKDAGISDVNTLPRSDRYVCRGDCKGVVLSRSCMAVASSALGHSRIDVIASNYLFTHGVTL